MTDTLDAPARDGKRADVQGLRTVAVVIVVLFHANVALSGGFVGVDVFFVISGFVITRKLAREMAGTGGLSLKKFYGQRARRLLPALALVLTFVALAGIVIGPLAGTRQTDGTGLAASLFSANFYLFHTYTGGYFATSSALNPLLHTWSLAVEEQFYLVFPGLLVLAALVANRFRWKVRSTLFTVLAAVTVLSFGLCVILVHGLSLPHHLGTASFAFYASPARAWEFGLGGLVALGTAGRRPLSGSLSDTFAMVGLALIAYAAVTYDGFTAFPGFTAAVPVVGTALLIWAGTGQRHLLSWLLEARWSQWIGDRSYGWYLWHWPFIVFAVACFPGIRWAPALAALISLPVAAASYRFVEQPLRQGPAPSRRVAAALHRRPVRLAAVAVLIPMVAFGVSHVGQGAVATTSKAKALAHQTSLHIDEHQGCDGPTYGTSTRCTWDVPHAKGSVVLIGDSNAGEYAEGFISGTNAAGFDATVATKSACPFVEVAIVDRSAPKQACTTFVNKSMAALIAAHPARVVIATAFSVYVQSREFRLGPPTGGATTGDPQKKADLLEQGVADVTRQFEHAHIPVTVVQPSPRFGTWDPQGCSWARVTVGVTGCAVSQSRAAAATYRRLSVAAVERATAATHASTVDLLPFICTPSRCETYRDGHWWFRDQGHISVYASQQLAPEFERVAAR